MIMYYVHQRYCPYIEIEQLQSNPDLRDSYLRGKSLLTKLFITHFPQKSRKDVLIFSMKFILQMEKCDAHESLKLNKLKLSFYSETYKNDWIFDK